MVTHQEVYANPYTTQSPPRVMCPLGFETIFEYELNDPPRGMFRSIHYPFITKKMCPLIVETIQSNYLHFTFTTTKVGYNSLA
jgi:hypothetical protein